MSEDKPKFGNLRLSVKNTNNGSGCDIYYGFGKSLNFVEFSTKDEFYFIQPWVQFPNRQYTDECLRVSIELVHRFNTYESLLKRQEQDEVNIKFLLAKVDKLEALVRANKEE